jgi:hypothetical protein
MAESQASSSDDCPNHDFWIARHPAVAANRRPQADFKD